MNEVGNNSFVVQDVINKIVAHKDIDIDTEANSAYALLDTDLRSIIIVHVKAGRR